MAFRQRQHAADLVAARLTYVTKVEDETLLFQQRETNSRKSYSQDQAKQQETRDTDLALAANAGAVQHANQQYDADRLASSSQQGGWRGETRIDNQAAEQKALAVIAFWTAQEPATVAAIDALHAEYEPPWTEFTPAQASR